MRSANNGISAVYDAYGREQARLGLDVAGVVDADLPRAVAPPLFARLGQAVPLALVLLCAAAALLSRRARITGLTSSGR